MKQNLVQLPKTAKFEIDGWEISIRNHKISSYGGLLNRLMNIVNNTRLGRNVLSGLEKHTVSFEAVIEYCVEELELRPGVLEEVIYGQYGIGERGDDKFFRVRPVKFSKSEKGRIIAGFFIDKIRDCENWGALYDTIRSDSKFSKKIKSKILKEEMK